MKARFEAGPQGGGMNRRDFLKAAGATLAFGNESATQEHKEDPHLTAQIIEILEHSSLNKIQYPDTFKPLDSEAEKILSLGDEYSKIFLDIGKNPVHNLELVDEAKMKLWNELKKIHPGIGEFSQEAFYVAITTTLPEYLAPYGIYVRNWPMTFHNNDQAGNPISVFRSELVIYFNKIGKIKRDDVEQGGNRIHRDIFYLEEETSINSGLPDYNTDRVMEVNYRSIFVYQSKVKSIFHDYVEAIRQIEAQIAQYPTGVFLSMKMQELQTRNDWSTATLVAMIKIIENLKPKADEQSYEEGNLAHETRHLIDRQNYSNFRKHWSFPNGIDDKKDKNANFNMGVHSEINAIIAELRYGPQKILTLGNYLNNSRDVLKDKAGIYGIAEKWILKQMVALIALDPEHYSIEIHSGSVSEENQILSQLDILARKPNLLDTLCDKILEFHNQHLGEDIMNEMLPLEIKSTVDKVRHTARWIPKIGIPAVTLGGAYLGLKKLAERKAKVKQENMSRDERRRVEREEKKKSKKLKK